MEMSNSLIGTIGCQAWEYTVGIVELRNDQVLTKDGFVDLASGLGQDLLVVQFMRPDFIAGVEHLLSASENAVNAWNGEYMISRNLDIEVVLYASAQRQIDQAFEDMGTIDGLETVALVAIGDSSDEIERCIALAQRNVGRSKDPPFQMSKKRFKRICEHFNIPDTELDAIASSTSLQSRYDALKKAVVSRVSMVALEA